MSSGSPCCPSQIPLPQSVEQLINRICMEQSVARPDHPALRSLLSLGEQAALDVLKTIAKTKIQFTFSGFIIYLVKRRNNKNNGVSPQKRHCFSPPNIINRSPTTPSTITTTTTTTTPSGSTSSVRLMKSPDSSDTGNVARRLSMSSEREIGGSFSPQLVALGELEFRKQFLILNYLGGRKLEDCIISADEIRRLKDQPMIEFETEVWKKLGQNNSDVERGNIIDWDAGKTHLYYCHVSLDGTCKFKGPFLNKERTLLRAALGDENVLMVKFAEEGADGRNPGINNYYVQYSQVAREGILVGLRRYRFFVFKDGGKEEKKKDPTSSRVKCYFVRMESNASIDENQSYILEGKTVHEARCVFMHVHTLPSVAKYMARLSLILSKTMKLDIDLASAKIEDIDDIHCQDADGNYVNDGEGKPRIHTDGTGFISEDLASKCPKNIHKGNCSDNVECGKGDVSGITRPGSHFEEPPLLIQCRLFYNGRAVKGTFLLSKELPPRTIRVRPSMIKVEADQTLSNTRAQNSLEVVSTSNRPKNTVYLSRNLIALLNYGGVQKEFFLNLAADALKEAQGVLTNAKAALRVSLNYGNMDNFTAATMISCNIPLDESYLQYFLLILKEKEKKSLGAGKLPIPECYYLMGTVDPTGKLNNDEVCIILDSGQISGKVLVYRNPGLHFGDIHVLTATYVKELGNIVGNAKYAIFFPIKGCRSLADEMAGGDFDGDMYFASRNPELLQNFKESERWTSASLKPNVQNEINVEFSSEVLEEELFRQFLTTRFNPSYTVGEAADSWLAFMDRLLTLGESSSEEKAHVKKNICQLIDIYYDALDAPKKNGIKIEVPEELQAKFFPHYMEKEQKNSFNSTSVLGLIYDTVKSYKAESSLNIEIRKLPQFTEEVPEAYMNKWKAYYDTYRKQMTDALRHGDDREGTNEATAAIIKDYKQKLYGAAEFEEHKRDLLELYAEALAIYNIVYDYAMSCGDVGKCHFAWKVAGPVLCKIYADKRGEKLRPCSYSFLKQLFG